jgi:predicted RNA binding protein YcfA (HicA-like mRNA interferase family)
MSKRVTFGMLADALDSLGFHLADDRNGHRVYEHETRPGILVLPAWSRQEVVSPAHLAAIEGTLANMEVVDPTEFLTLVQTAR